MFILLGACSSVNDNSAADSNAVADGGATAPTPTPAPSPTGTSINSVTYDTSIGNGVDANGFADLPLRLGAKRFYVNSSTGSDSNGCAGAQSPSSPVATVKAAVACVTAGQGDQVLLAEGTSYPRGLAFIGDKGGYSPVYPFVIQSYDPADPTNEAKFGRASGSNRPIVNPTGADMTGGFIQGNNVQKYRALRGLKFDSANKADASLNAFAGNPGTPDYLLFENDIFAATALTVQGSAQQRIKKVILRNCASYGQWGNSLNDHAQGIFADNTDGLTIEDSVFWHNGWNVTATRASDPTVGGPTIFNHPIYAQDTTRSTVVRRNVFIDTSTDGGNLKGGGVYTQNLSIRNPNAAAAGSGNNYSVDAPNGVAIEMAYNVVIGGGAITASSGNLDWGFHVANGAPGSSVHHNVLARSAQAGYALMIDAPVDTLGGVLPSYADFHDNVSYQWNASGNSTMVGMPGQTLPANLSLIHASFDNNIWDGPASGTNSNISSHTFPNVYTESSLLSALGYADETSFINDVINNPEKHVQRNAVELMLDGYGVDTSAMQW
jgi:hypothetical protein